METVEHKESALLVWVAIVLMCIGILGQGFYAYLVVGDMGQPTWDYRPVADVPGQSPYAVYVDSLNPQHVMETPSRAVTD